MKLGERGELLIKEYEHLALKAYLPTSHDRWTIGWGHTRGVKSGMSCTVEQADIWFAEDVEIAVSDVNKEGMALTQSMFDALVSLVYNVGPMPVTNRSVIGRALAVGNYFVAWQYFALWRKQGNKNLLGLARRRAREMVLFLEDGLP
jgi:lysozyme